ncbi:nicotinamide riboside transporter PnuC [Pontibacter sp. BAB1700]|uniref:nicotinamide riboside transporter PnuC n=1 Tax=Pontibacter sp. BAB1700 TaxID=1144253 RepID=UPI00026BE953|nr:nicotinamide riboside transporter PnuC [Pontibacter sp. BAB1700]EJF09300.1 nicotinamide mononucleotide transporter PnuC [Pontibacter sp. BAB1700]
MTGFYNSILEGLQAMSLVEVIGVITGIAGVWLAAKQNVWTWPISVVSVTAYVFIFYDARLYADMGLNAFYIITSFYGWYEWLYGGKGHTERKVTKVGQKELWVLIALVVAFTGGLGYFLDNYTDADLSYTDSATTAVSLMAYWLMAKKRLENWLVWLAVDVVYVGVYTYKELYLTAFLYFIFLILATIGYLDWKRDMEKETVAHVTK